MSAFNRFKEKLFDLTPQDFNDAALEIFEVQSSLNPIYKNYIGKLGVNPKSITSIHAIPFLPIEFFKFHAVKTGSWKTSRTFLSSGTTSTGRSQHHVRDVDFYLRNSQRIFEATFGSLAQMRILALLPSYLEQGDSSLICMVDHLIRHGQTGSTYFRNFNEVKQDIAHSENILLIGVTYALLDLAKEKALHSFSPIILETGGMKGRKKEITRAELHEGLSKLSPNIFTEYGMTELMSQAYGRQGRLKWPPWCKSLIRDLNDPRDISESGTGALNIIDLANVDTCCFIETKDLGIVGENDEFEVLGRMDNSDIRGCSLLI